MKNGRGLLMILGVLYSGMLWAVPVSTKEIAVQKDTKGFERVVHLLKPHGQDLWIEAVSLPLESEESTEEEYLFVPAPFIKAAIFMGGVSREEQEKKIFTDDAGSLWWPRDPNRPLLQYSLKVPVHQNRFDLAYQWDVPVQEFLVLVPPGMDVTEYQVLQNQGVQQVFRGEYQVYAVQDLPASATAQIKLKVPEPSFGLVLRMVLFVLLVSVLCLFGLFWLMQRKDEPSGRVDP